jgi:hypothetical protein
MNIPRKPVRSSNIKSVGHDGKSTLQVEFHSGQVWNYPADAAQHRAMITAPSVGAYFHRNIRDLGGTRVS